MARERSALSSSASVCPFSTRSHGRTFITVILPPAGGYTCTTRVGSGSTCAGNSRYTGTSFASTRCVLIPRASAGTTAASPEPAGAAALWATPPEFPQPPAASAAAKTAILKTDFIESTPIVRPTQSPRSRRPQSFDANNHRCAQVPDTHTENSMGGFKREAIARQADQAKELARWLLRLESLHTIRAAIPSASRAAARP